MKIEQAIEILQVTLNYGTEVTTTEYDNALKLGIEALKEVNALRKVLIGLGKSLLPGETKE